MIFNTDIFQQFDKKWALLTSGSEDNYNTMTISWGSLGTIWNKPTATVYVRGSRYTHDYIDSNDYFTISFYPEKYKKELGILGSKSGREMDKMSDSGLTAIKIGTSITFKEAELTIVCKKLFKQRLLSENMPADVVNAFYGDNDLHDMYIGEVIDIVK